MQTSGTEFQCHVNIITSMYINHAGANDILHIVVFNLLPMACSIVSISVIHYVARRQPFSLSSGPYICMVLLCVDRPDIHALIQAMGELVVSRMLDPLIVHHRLFHIHPPNMFNMQNVPFQSNYFHTCDTQLCKY